MESAEPLKRVYELCDDAFSPHFHSPMEIQRKATCPTVGPTPAPETAIEKTWAPAQSHQMTTLKHHLLKEDCVLSAATGICF